MNGRQVSYVFFFFALAIIVVADQPGEVSVSGTTVTLNCPLVPPGEEDQTFVKWHKKGEKEGIEENRKFYSISDYSNTHNGLYYCEDSAAKTNYYFFIKAKVCSGCVEVDMTVTSLIVFGDVVFTLVIVAIVYRCAQKKAGTAAPQRATQPRQARGQARAPPPPDPDYQPLNPATRANDVYSQAHRR